MHEIKGSFGLEVSYARTRNQGISNAEIRYAWTVIQGLFLGECLLMQALF